MFVRTMWGGPHVAPGNKKGNIKFGKGPGLQCPENYTVIDLTQKLFFINFLFFFTGALAI